MKLILMISLTAKQVEISVHILFLINIKLSNIFQLNFWISFYIYLISLSQDLFSDLLKNSILFYSYYISEQYYIL